MSAMPAMVSIGDNGVLNREVSETLSDVWLDRDLGFVRRQRVPELPPLSKRFLEFAGSDLPAIGCGFARQLLIERRANTHPRGTRFVRWIRRGVIGNGMNAHSDQNGRNQSGKAVPEAHGRSPVVYK